MRAKSRNRSNQSTVIVPLAAFTAHDLEPDGRVAILTGKDKVEIRLSAATGKALAFVPKEDVDSVLARASALAARAGIGHGIRRVYDTDIARVLGVEAPALRKSAKYRPAVV